MSNVCIYTCDRYTVVTVASKCTAHVLEYEAVMEPLQSGLPGEYLYISIMSRTGFAAPYIDALRSLKTPH